MNSISRIYLRLPNWIGDVCMSLPSLHAVLASGCEVVVCAKPWARDLLSGFDHIDFIALTGKWREDRNLIKNHRRQHKTSGQSVGLLLPDSLTSCLSFRLAGLACAGYKDDGRTLLLKWPVDKPEDPLHAVESWYYLTQYALRQWGFLADEQPPKHLDLPLTTEHYASAQDLIDSFKDEAFIVIAPTATGKHLGREKVWPHFNALTQYLQAEGHLVVMAPPPAETAMALTNAPSATLLEPMSLGTFVALLKQAKWVICNDSGVSHLAAAAQTPQITLVGVTSAERTGPWSNRAVVLGKMDAWPSLQTVLDQL